MVNARTLSDVVIRDVTLRDGLQLTGGLLNVEQKVRVVRSLVDAGIQAIEVGSLARPDLVPPLANTLDVVRALTPEERDLCWVWIATAGHARRAVEAGITHMQYCLSVSSAHNVANVGREPAQSMDMLPEVLEIAAGAGADVQLCLATSFTCPFEGAIEPDAVLALANDPRAAGVTDLVVCDTLGQASPAQVRDLVARVVAAAKGRGVVFHGHDTWGMGVANALAAIEAGATTVDGALGGLGGCPFAPGASGNTATEDLVIALRPTGIDPARFASLVRLGETVLSDVGERSRSRAAEAARLSPSDYLWSQNLDIAG